MLDQHGFQTATAVDRRGWLWVASMLSLTYSLLTLAARLTVKWDLLYYDDAALGVAYVFAIAHYGTMYTSISFGLGASAVLVPYDRLAVVAKLFFISRILSAISQCLVKASILIFTRRIFSGDLYKEKRCFFVAYTTTVAFGLCAVCLSSAGCDPRLSIVSETNAVCASNIARWAITTALDVITEVIIVCLPLWFISKNRMRKSKKAIVVFVFSFRLVVAALSIIATASYVDYLIGQDDIIGIAPTVAWQEVQLGFSLLSASIPCLKSFLWAFMSRGLRGMSVSGSMSGVHMNDSSTPVTSPTDVPLPSNTCTSTHVPPIFSAPLRPDTTRYKARVRTPYDARSRAAAAASVKKSSDESVGSGQLVIHTTREVNVKRS